MNAIHFRPLTAADREQFFALRRAAILAGCAGHYGAQLLEAWTDPATDGALPDPPSKHFYFAEVGAQTAGTGMLDLDKAWIDGVFVDPAFVGRGIGTAIVRYLEDVARSHGLQRLGLQATLNAAVFYRSLGFAGDTIGTYHSPRGLALPCVPMSKQL